MCGRTWCVSVSWCVLLGRNLEFKLSTALGETLLHVRTWQVQSAWTATFPPYAVCPCELACVPRILLQLSVSIRSPVVCARDRSSDPFGVHYPARPLAANSRRVRSLLLSLSLFVITDCVGVEQRQFGNFWDRSKVCMESLVVWTAHSRHQNEV